MNTKLKQILDDRDIPYKKVAEITGVSAATVTRYLSGETEAPFEFVKEVAKYLKISMDVLSDNTAGIKNDWESAALERLEASYEKLLESKREAIADLKQQIERLEADHEEEIARLERAHEKEIGRIEKNMQAQIDHAEKESENRRQRMDKKNKIIMRLFVTLIVISLASLYFVIDAYNGDWGLVRYEALLELLPDVFGAHHPELSDPADGITGLWNRI